MFIEGYSCSEQVFIALSHVLPDILDVCWNLSHPHGFTSQKYPMADRVNLIEKKDRDKRYIKNWQPIPLLNVDKKDNYERSFQKTKKYSF